MVGGELEGDEVVEEIARKAEEMAREQRAISVSEFFERNRHLL